VSIQQSWVWNYFLERKAVWKAACQFEDSNKVKCGAEMSLNTSTLSTTWSTRRPCKKVVFSPPETSQDFSSRPGAPAKKQRLLTAQKIDVKHRHDVDSNYAWPLHAMPWRMTSWTTSSSGDPLELVFPKVCSVLIHFRP